MESADASGNLPMQNVNDFSFIDFLDETNFQQFIELIRGENGDPIVDFCPSNIDHDQPVIITGSNNSLAPETDRRDFPADQLDFYDVNVGNMCEIPNYSGLDELLVPENLKDFAEEENDDDDESSATTTATTNDNAIPSRKRSSKVDRSRTLISERRRRGRMKEKLYALRALVPTITKMDKASIIGDAVLYVQELQKQAKKLKSEIASLESSFRGTDHFHSQRGAIHRKKSFNATCNSATRKKISKMDVFQVEERGFYVRVVSSKGPNVSASLYKALESLTGFNLQTSNLTTASENYILTFSFNVMGDEVVFDLRKLKLWIATSFANQGFDFQTSLSP